MLTATERRNTKRGKQLGGEGGAGGGPGGGDGAIPTTDGIAKETRHNKIYLQNTFILLYACPLQT
jgi:hypothetical protein